MKIAHRLNSLEERTAVVPVRIKNFGVRSMVVESLIFYTTDSGIQPVLEPHLVVELCPFFDSFCVIIENTGQADFAGGRLQLIDESRHENLFMPLNHLLGVGDDPIEIGKLSSRTMLVVPFEPFQAFSYAIPDLAGLDRKRKRSVGPPRNSTETYATGKVVPEQRIVGELYSGTATVTGRLLLGDSISMPLDYFGRSLAPVDIFDIDSLAGRYSSTSTNTKHLHETPILIFGGIAPSIPFGKLRRESTMGSPLSLIQTQVNAAFRTHST